MSGIVLDRNVMFEHFGGTCQRKNLRHGRKLDIESTGMISNSYSPSSKQNPDSNPQHLVLLRLTIPGAERLSEKHDGKIFTTTRIRLVLLSKILYLHPNISIELSYMTFLKSDNNCQFGLHFKPVSVIFLLQIQHVFKILE
jgi:hypothetical protein